MYKKISILLLAVVVMTLAMAGNAFAQVSYDITNNSPVSVSVTMGGLCPGPTLWTSTKLIAPGLTQTFVIPSVACTWSISVNGGVFIVGDSKPLPPPNPPSWITVTAINAVIQ